MAWGSSQGEVLQRLCNSRVCKEEWKEHLLLGLLHQYLPSLLVPSPLSPTFAGSFRYFTNFPSVFRENQGNNKEHTVLNPINPTISLLLYWLSKWKIHLNYAKFLTNKKNKVIKFSFPTFLSDQTKGKQNKSWLSIFSFSLKSLFLIIRLEGMFTTML